MKNGTDLKMVKSSKVSKFNRVPLRLISKHCFSPDICEYVELFCDDKCMVCGRMQEINKIHPSMIMECEKAILVWLADSILISDGFTMTTLA